ncbi:MAG: metallophosphoesterase family protein [Planctomycetes bacterium]|nr:metallophosphoesterase family protein [Planctomycetota bacterium]
MTRRFLMPRVLLQSFVFLTLGVLATAPGVLGHEGHAHPEPQRVPDKEAYRPSAIPDRIVLTWNGDPAATQAVTWRTDTSVHRAFAEVAVAEDGPFFSFKAARVEAETSKLETNLGEAHYHSAVFEKLKPQTRYAYRVGDGENWSEWSQFSTASEKPEPFTFVYFGDAQNEIKSYWSRVVREAYRDAPKAAFLLHAGDLVNRATNDGEWGEWFYAGSHIHRMASCIATPGNHEYSSASGERALTPHWPAVFAFPQNGPEGFKETVYWIDYQGVRVISLNSNEKQEAQVAWLESVLADNPNRWTVITFHHPIYSASRGRDNPGLRELWQPIFDKHRVDLVLQGHDHSYARSGLMTHKNVPTGATNFDEEAGTLYVVSVSGPKMYTLDREPFMRRAAENTQLYQIITVDGDELRYEARTAVGRLYDAFTLRKREGKPNELIEQVPDTPENRR